MTTTLTEPDGAQTEWPGPLPGAEPLPGQLDRWLASRGAELVAIRRHIHAHPEPSYREFETTALVARELAVAGLTLFLDYADRKSFDIALFAIAASVVAAGLIITRLVETYGRPLPPAGRGKLPVH